MDMSTIITAITSVVTAAVGWLGVFAEAVASNPLLLIGVVLGFVGVGVGLLSRLLHL